MALPPLPVGLYPSHEILVEQRWWLGAGKHKITSTVFHRGQGIVQHGHDCGALIADEAPPLLGRGNGYLPLILLGSSRKIMFGASTVRAEGAAIGGAEASGYPMLTCGNPISLPYTYPTKNKDNTVLVGLTVLDITRGWQDIAVTMAIDVILFGLSLAKPGGGLGGLLGVDWMKTGLTSAAGLGLSIKRSAESGWKEPITLRVEAGNIITDANEVIYHPDTGEFELVRDTTAGPLAGSVKRGKDGKIEAMERLPPDPFSD